MKYSGVVQKGVRRGAALGFPTANIALPDGVPSGIYAARAYLKKDEAPYMTAVFVDEKRKLLEAYILDFSNDLYGQTITIELHQKIRDRKDFKSENELRAAIADDIDEVRTYFSNHT